MSGPRIGELFAGYGGLGMGVQAALGGEIAWYSEIDKGALKILEHRFPDVPNVGDITTVDWSQVEPVDILTGGSPCQDLSHAGKRAGMTEGTRSNLWVAMREAIAQLRPGLVIWENVRGAYSAEADSDLVANPRLLADTRRRDGEPVLRALGRVLGDLSELGYVGGWHGLRAADVGAPHGRFRVFVVAYPASDAGRIEYGDRASLALAADVRRERAGAAWDGRPRPEDGGLGDVTLLPTPTSQSARHDADDRGPGTLDDHNLWSAAARIGNAALLPTPRAGDGEKGGPNQRGSSGDLMLPSAVTHLLPTPAVNDMGAAYTPEQWDAWCEAQKAKHGNGNGHGKSLHVEAARLVPTPTGRDWRDGGDTGADVEDKAYLGRVVWNREAWGQYAEAIHRWETLTRAAPSPTELNKLGNRRLAPAFSEWLMGLPAGWVTDVPGITRNEALRALGNGVVPQQAEAAVRFLLAHFGEVAA